jgi:hypothetical protein
MAPPALAYYQQVPQAISLMFEQFMHRAILPFPQTLSLPVYYLLHTACEIKKIMQSPKPKVT